MILVDIKPGDRITLNGVSGVVVGVNGVPDKIAFIDLEPK